MRRNVPERFSRFLNICLGVADVPGPKWLVLGFQPQQVRIIRKQPLSQERKQFIERRSLTASDIRNVALGTSHAGGCGQDVHLNYISDKTKIATCFAIAVDK